MRHSARPLPALRCDGCVVLCATGRVPRTTSMWAVLYSTGIPDWRGSFVRAAARTSGRRKRGRTCRTTRTCAACASAWSTYSAASACRSVGPTPHEGKCGRPQATPPPHRPLRVAAVAQKWPLINLARSRNQVSSISEHFDDLTRLVTAWAVGCLPRGNPPAPPRTHAPTDRPARALRRAQRLIGMRHE